MTAFRRTASWAGLIGLLALVAPGCSPAHGQGGGADHPWLDPALLAAAKGEGSLIVYSSTNEQEGLPLFKIFEEATGIKVDYDTFDSDQTLEAKLLAGGSGYDVVSTATNYFSRQIRAGAYRKLDRAKLTGWSNLDPKALALMATADPGNQYAVPYMHAINGYSYNVEMVRQRMPDAPVDSLDLIFKPENIRRFADCGVTFLDSPEDVLQLALVYLHLDPNTVRAEDYAAAEALILKVRPYIKTFDSVEYLNSLANQETCIAMSWSSDYAVSMARMRQAGLDVKLAFTVPKEGANATYSAMLIPVDAPHVAEAHEFLNFLLRPEVIARITNETHYANENLAANDEIQLGRSSFVYVDDLGQLPGVPNANADETMVIRGRQRTTRDSDSPTEPPPTTAAETVSDVRFWKRTTRNSDSPTEPPPPAGAETMFDVRFWKRVASVHYRLNLDMGATGAVALTLLAGTPALTFTGMIGAALAVTLHRGGLLLAVLVLPLSIPALIFGVAASQAAITGLSFGAPFSILSALSLVSFVIGPFAAAASLRHGLD